MSTPAAAARHLTAWAREIPDAVMRGADETGKRVTARAAVLTRRPGGMAPTPRSVGQVYKLSRRSAGVVWVIYKPRYLAAWDEYGTKPHSIVPKLESRRTRRAQRNLGKALDTGRTAKQRARSAAAGARALSGAYKGVLKMTPKGGGDAFYARRAQSPGMRPARPLARAILAEQGAAQTRYAAGIAAAWTRTK